MKIEHGSRQELEDYKHIACAQLGVFYLLFIIQEIRTIQEIIVK